LKNALNNTLCELLAESLPAWGLTGSVRDDCGTILLSCGATEIRVERGAADLPFRWMVTVNGRRRGAISLVAVLRQVRAALDRHHPMTQVRVAAPAVVSPDQIP
jgi:hypothetical protein